MLLVKNRKAFYNYEIVEKYVAGVVLKGYEVKAIREKKVNFEGAYIKISGEEAFVVNLHIGRYSKKSQKNEASEQDRDIKLLLNLQELEKIMKEVKQKGKTVIPIAFILRNNLVKLELAVVKGRKEYEKKQVAKTRQVEKDLQQQRKSQIWK